LPRSVERRIADAAPVVTDGSMEVANEVDSTASGTLTGKALVRARAGMA
jgi:hypothetical protein